MLKLSIFVILAILALQAYSKTVPLNYNGLSNDFNSMKLQELLQGLYSMESSDEDDNVPKKREVEQYVLKPEKLSDRDRGLEYIKNTVDNDFNKIKIDDDDINDDDNNDDNNDFKNLKLDDDDDDDNNNNNDDNNDFKNLKIDDDDDSGETSFLSVTKRVIEAKKAYEKLSDVEKERVKNWFKALLYQVAKVAKINADKHGYTFDEVIAEIKNTKSVKEYNNNFPGFFYIF